MTSSKSVDIGNFHNFSTKYPQIYASFIKYAFWWYGVLKKSADVSTFITWIGDDVTMSDDGFVLTS